jgi:uncharacterized protein with PIN domain
MKTAQFRFYGELNDFLPGERRQRALRHTYLDSAPVKDIIESLGVPHTEVHLILVNGISSGFSYTVQDGDSISVYPVFRRVDIGNLGRASPEPPGEPRFVLDIHLGRLAAYLRMMGLDALYEQAFGDEQLAALSREEDRILLTRDIGLLKRGAVRFGYFVRETNPRRQLAEVSARFRLERHVRPFSRCLRCNVPLRAAEKEEVAGRLPGRTRDLFHEFLSCPVCKRVFWKGGHYERMRRLIDTVAGPAPV